MPETEKSVDADSSAQPPPRALDLQNDPDSPQPQSKASENTQKAKQLLSRFFIEPSSRAIEWIDDHNGLFTAIATGAIAWLTLSLAEDSKRQAESATGQLGAIRGQLDEMRLEQRPWIYADVTPLGVFRSQTGGFTFSFSFKEHNVGHLPAFYVAPDIEGFLSGEGKKSGRKSSAQDRYSDATNQFSA